MTAHCPNFVWDRIMFTQILESVVQNNGKRYSCPCVHHEDIKGNTVTTALICNLSRK
jgi:hypothetical protein